MRNRTAHEKRCSYVVVWDECTLRRDDLRDFAAYLSTLGVAECDVVVLDGSPREEFAATSRCLRWVARHLPARAEWRNADGTVDAIRAAAAVSACEKVIVADADVRYTSAAIAQMCDLLDAHEVVEPQDYLDATTWWSGIDAGRILVRRGIEPEPDHGATFAFRRNAVRDLRCGTAWSRGHDHVRRLAGVGAQTHAATDVFVRREAGALREWLSDRPRLAGSEFAWPMRTAFFLTLLPLLALLAMLGGPRLAGEYAGLIAFGSFALAVRGRAGAASFFPMRACLFAPLWVVERSISVYWALFRKLRGHDAAASRVAVPDRGRERVASGE